MKLSPYPRYKPTGIDWLGDVPAHWVIRRLKSVTRRIDEKVEPNDADPVPYIGLEHIEPWTGRLFVSDSDVQPVGMSNRFRSGDTLFGKLRPYLAKACNPDFEGICSSELLVLRSVVLDRRFLLYALLTEGFVSLVDSSTYGAKMPRASWTFTGACALPLPPLPEQQRIAGCLDCETAKVDSLISKERALIQKLREKRSALISQVVTRGLPPEAARAAGLNPRPKLKPSGIEWIGDIPEHWETRRLRHISDRITVGVVVNPSSYVTDEGVPFLLGGDIREFSIDITQSNRCASEISDGALVKSRLNERDVVVVRVGYPGVAAVVPRALEGGNCASIMIVGNHPRFSSEWLAHAFNSKSGRDQIEIVQYGAAQKQFNISHAVDFVFPFPPLREQTMIARYLESERVKIDHMIEKIEEAIERLQEYRTALITAAVTGKIDLRDVAPASEPAGLVAAGCRAPLRRF